MLAAAAVWIAQPGGTAEDPPRPSVTVSAGATAGPPARPSVAAPAGASDLVVDADARDFSLSPDGSRLATWRKLNDAAVWDARSGERVSTVEAGGFQVALNGSGSMVAAGHSGSVALHDSATGRIVGFLTTSEPALITGISFSPDGALAAVALDEGSVVEVFDVARRERRATLRTGQGTVASVAISPDSTLIATAGCTTGVKLWRVTGGGLASFNRSAVSSPADADWCYQHVRFSPDGRHLVTVGDSLVDPQTHTTVVSVWQVADRTQQPRNVRISATQGPAAFVGDGSCLLSVDGTRILAVRWADPHDTARVVATGTEPDGRVAVDDAGRLAAFRTPAGVRLHRLAGACTPP